MSRYLKHDGLGENGHRLGLLQSKSTGIFFADYWETGKRITRSLKTADLDEAKKVIGHIALQRMNRKPTRGREGETILYVIQRGDSGPIKVGITRSLKKRISQLQNGNAEKLRVLRVYRMRDVEQAVHAELERASRLEGEWFPIDLLSRVDSFFNVPQEIIKKREEQTLEKRLMSLGCLPTVSITPGHRR